MSATTDDAFLGGRLQLLQPARGYRAGIDPVLLAASVPAKPGDTVLDLGCGVGAAGLCLAMRIRDIHLVGVDIQADLADLARENLSRNGVTGQIVTADARALPDAVRQLSFTHVIANPPFFDRARGSSASDVGRDVGRGGETPLSIWVDVATRRLSPKGRVTLIQRAERLPQVLSAFDRRVGDILIQPIAARLGRDAELVVVSARKGAKGAARLAAPLILHQGAAHDGDRDSYTPEANAILRDAKEMPGSA